MGMFWIAEQRPPGKFGNPLIWIRLCASSTDGEMEVRREMEASPGLVAPMPMTLFQPSQLVFLVCIGPLLGLVGGYYSWQKEHLKVPDWHSAQKLASGLADGHVWLGLEHLETLNSCSVLLLASPQHAGSVWTESPTTNRLQCIVTAGCLVQQTQICSRPLAMEEEPQELLGSPAHLANILPQGTNDHSLFSHLGKVCVLSRVK